MATPVRVNEDNYIKLKSMAESEGRTPTNMLNRILDERFGRSTLGVPVENTPPQKTTEVQTPYMKPGGTPAKSDVSDLLAEEVGAKINIQEQECCQHPTRPCKHWVWDINTGEGYINSLSGRKKEV